MRTGIFLPGKLAHFDHDEISDAPVFPVVNSFPIKIIKLFSLSPADIY